MLTFSHAELIEVLANIMCKDESLVFCEVSAMQQVHLNKSADESKDDSGSAAAEAAAPCPAVVEVDLQAQASLALEFALQSIDNAASTGEGVKDFELATERIKAITWPLARGAAEAQQLVDKVLGEQQKCLIRGCKVCVYHIIMKANSDVRDVVVLRCRSCLIDPKDRLGFCTIAQEAYDVDESSRFNYVDKVRAQLLLSYHKANSEIR